MSAPTGVHRASRDARGIAGLPAGLLAFVASVSFASPAAAQLAAAQGSVVVGRMEHRVDAGYGVAASTGTVLGAGIRVRAWQLIELDASALGGGLQGDTVARGDRRMGEATVRLNMLPLPWLAVGAVGALRGYDTPAATQRWTMLGAGAELRLDFAGGGIRTVVGTSLFPSVSVSGQASPDLGVSTLAGLQLTRGRLLASMDYRLDRFVFPSDAVAGTRHEQLSGLLVRLGGRW